MTELNALADRAEAATGPWLPVGSFTPEPNEWYLVQGCLRTSIKMGRDIDRDNMFAAQILSDPRVGLPGFPPIVAAALRAQGEA